MTLGDELLRGDDAGRRLVDHFCRTVTWLAADYMQITVGHRDHDFSRAGQPPGAAIRFDNATRGCQGLALRPGLDTDASVTRPDCRTTGKQCNKQQGQVTHSDFL